VSLRRVLDKERDLKEELTVRCDLNLNLECWAGGFENGSFVVLEIGRLCGSRLVLKSGSFKMRITSVQM
jgi:hypothetical protein